MKRQKQVLKYLQTVDKATLKEIYENTNITYHYNWRKHLGNVVSRMVMNKSVVRVGKGVFRISGRSRNHTEQNENQLGLFD